MVTSTTGLTLLAANTTTKFYWHHYDALVPPTSNFTGTPQTGTGPLQVSFTDTSTGNPTSWSWDFGDGSTSTAQNPTHTYTTPGSYDVRVTATNPQGSDTVTKAGYVVVAPPPAPAADFMATPRSGAAPLAVSFTDASTNGPTSWSWDFGDGTTSTARNPTHTYTTPGSYDVTLTASNAGGSSAPTTKTGYVVVDAPPAPAADFMATPRSGAAPLAVSFTDGSTNGPTSWSWDFGDGTTSTARNPTHTYTTPGSYDVTLTASNAGGSSAPTTKTGYIKVYSTLTLSPVADSDVASLSPTKNYGTTTTLRVRLASDTTTSTHYSDLKFDVSGVTGAVVGAKLRMLPSDASVDSGSVYSVDTGWTETGITWNTAPPIGGTPLAGPGTATVGVWKEWDLGSTAVPGNGTYAFGIKSSNSNTVIYSSRQGANPPQLVLTLAP
jgi:PKD repeat protein